jgi:hypothetical protein
MEQLPPEHAEPEIDALLRAARPVADAAWVARTEAALLEPRGLERWLAWRPAPALRLGTAFALALTVLVLGLALAGVGPLGGASEPVVADDKCRTVSVESVERVPRLVDEPGAEPRIVYERRRVQRLERRCR